ncbi:MAG TPA: TldD/PmbA family protein [Nitrosopumilaceae archaeon]|nr:TldD/PmbA family protein [Nitrosopumilaceae archaeon]
MENNLQDFAEKAVEYASILGCQYCDVRAENKKNQGFLIENSEIEYASTKNDSGLGIRILNDGAWGFFSLSDPLSLDDVRKGVEEASKTALNYASTKKHKSVLRDIDTVNEKIDFPVKIIPTIEKLIEIGYDCDKIILQNKRVIKSQVSIGYSTASKFFVNSEGSKISQNFTDVVADLAATAHENGITQTVNITEGGRGGIEKLSSKKEITETSEFISKKASQLIDAKPAKNEKATVVMNPDFVALLTHEILGHPSEADRVLGKEMAWAGGAWWAGKLNEKIGSKSLNVFDDPTIEGTLGCYGYDDEGSKSSRTNLVENGVLSNHMQSRETAEIFHSKPSANMRATSYRYMPLIRMACTCIDKGDWKPEEMISEIKNGYLISNMKVPSIDMKRYNWSISCQFAQKIENGEVTDLLRDVIVLGTAPDFFKSIDACGNDFTIRAITNCGKGDPMQSMVMGNGGPSIRATATVRSV